MESFRTFSSKTMIGIAASFIAHILLLILCLILAPKSILKVPQKVTVVDLMEDPVLPRRPTQPHLEDKRYVRSAPAPADVLTEEEKEKRFASDRVQNVLEEQQARKSGLTANRSEEIEKIQHGENRRVTKRQKLDFKPRSPLEKLVESDGELKGDVDVGGMKQEQEKNSSVTGKALDFTRFGSLEKGTSTMGESMPADIKIGDFTALNTDRHLYYTFYSRIEEEIRGPWVNYIRATIYGMENGTIAIPASRSWTTNLEIVLDRTGKFIKAILHDSSGSKNLDSAPVQAFRDVRQFPNPPTEMLKKDGTIRLLYSFSVNIVPSYAADDTTE
jgi:TonB family protein